ncbi:MAG: zinc metallopeptidase [Armatimonadota bacterium]
MFYFDYTMVLLIPAILLSLYAQWKVSSTFAKYSQVPNRRGLTGAEVANAILNGFGTSAGIEQHKFAEARSGLAAVHVEPVPGSLSDHYDPGARVLRLSEPVYGSRSIAAVSVAAHEAGHALQHAVAYPYLGLRSVVVPVAQFGSKLAFPILIVGFIIPSLFMQALNIAILLYIGIVAFTIITLPVEFNASRRALRVLEEGGYLATDEMPGARAVLNAAALTYVAATVSAVLMLLRLILLRNMADRE